MAEISVDSEKWDFGILGLFVQVECKEACLSSPPLRWEGSFEAVHKAGASPGMQDVAEKAVSNAVRAAMMAWMMA